MKCSTSSCVHVHVLVLIGLRWEWDVNVVFSVYCRVLPKALRRYGASWGERRLNNAHVWVCVSVLSRGSVSLGRDRSSCIAGCIAICLASSRSHA